MQKRVAQPQQDARNVRVRYISDLEQSICRVLDFPHPILIEIEAYAKNDFGFVSFGADRAQFFTQWMFRGEDMFQKFLRCLGPEWLIEMRCFNNFMQEENQVASLWNSYNKLCAMQSSIIFASKRLLTDALFGKLPVQPTVMCNISEMNLTKRQLWNKFVDTHHKDILTYFQRKLEESNKQAATGTDHWFVEFGIYIEKYAKAWIE